MSFTSIPIITDRESAIAAFEEKMAAAFPGWESMPADLTTWIAEWIADEYPDLANLAAEMSALAFRTFGETVLGVPPIVATAATVDSTWTLTDDDGHTINAGTQVQISDGADNLYAFVVTDDIEVLAGDTTTDAGEVPLQALVTGEIANDLSDAPTLIDALAFVDSIALVGSTSGGVNDEIEDDYLDRLVDEFKLLSKVLILPADVATAARRVAGVARATVIDNYYPGVNEVQSIIATGGSAGTFILTYSGQTTASIAYNATATTIKDRLEALSNIAPGDVVVTGGPLPNTAVEVEFTGTLSATNVSEMTVTDSITGGDATVTTTTAGVDDTTGNEKTLAVFPIDSDGNDVSDAVKEAVEDELEARREVGFLFYVDDPIRTPVKVSTTVIAWDGVDEDGLETSIEGAITDYLSPSNWGLSPFDDDPGIWLNDTVVRRFELVALVENVEGVRHVTALTLATQGGSLGTSDVTLSGGAALPTPGTITASVA